MEKTNAAFVAAELVDVGLVDQGAALLCEVRGIEQALEALYTRCGDFDARVVDMVLSWKDTTLGADADIDEEVMDAVRQLSGAQQLQEALNPFGVDLSLWWPDCEAP